MALSSRLKHWLQTEEKQLITTVFSSIDVRWTNKMLQMKFLNSARESLIKGGLRERERGENARQCGKKKKGEWIERWEERNEEGESVFRSSPVFKLHTFKYYLYLFNTIGFVESKINNNIMEKSQSITHSFPWNRFDSVVAINICGAWISLQYDSEFWLFESFFSSPHLHSVAFALNLFVASEVNIHCIYNIALLLCTESILGKIVPYFAGCKKPSYYRLDAIVIT